MSASLYDSRSLTQAINKMNLVNPFVLNKIFKKKEQHGSDKIDVEIITGSEKLAQFVSTNEPTPKNIAKLTRTVKTVTLPRTFESKIWSAQELMDFSSIGAIYDESSKKLAQFEKIAMNLADLKDRALRRREQMAIEALATGKVSVTQNNTAFEVDFGFVDTEQLVTLSGTDLFTNSASKPVGKFRAWSKSIMKRSGVNADICLLGASAAEAFIGNAEVLKALDTNNNKIGQLDLTVAPVPGAFFLGRIAGIEFWEVTQQYVNDSNVATDMLAADRAVLVASNAPFRLHYGPAYRISNQQATAIMGEFYVEVDSHSGTQMLQWNCEQKSLPTIHDPGAVISAKVV